MAIGVGAGLVCIVAAAIVDDRRDRDIRAAWVRPLLVATGVGLLVWLPTLVDEAASQGNLSDVVDYATAGHDNVAGLSRALGIVAATFRLPPPWLVGDSMTGVTHAASVAWLAIPLALLTIGLFAAHRSQSRDGRRLLVLLAVVTSPAPRRWHSSSVPTRAICSRGGSSSPRCSSPRWRGSRRVQSG